jgi:thiol:disulfide interchange protein
MAKSAPRLRHILAALAIACASASAGLVPGAGAGALSAEEARPVRASLAAVGGSIHPGEAFAVNVVLDIDAGWHVYGPASSLGSDGTGLPTSLAWELPPGFSVLPLEWPPLQAFSFGGVESKGYTGRLVLHASILPPRNLAPGSSVPIKLRVDWLVCKDVCMPGSAELVLTLSAGAGGGGGLPGLLLALLLAFLGGLILNLMPCVLPVLSLKALSLAKRAEGGRALGQGLLYTAGVLVSFWLFAGLLLILRAGGDSAGWGFQLQNPIFVTVAALVFFLLGLNLFGVFELGASLTRLGSIGSGPVGPGSAAKGGAGRVGLAPGLASFLGGLFATAVATPCTAPFMGVAIGYALSHGTAAALGVFSFLGLGMAAPLLALSAFPALARRLPKPGPWMLRFRQALGFPMMAAVVWMAFVLAGLGGASALISLLEGLLAVGLGSWLWGIFGGVDRPRGARVAAVLLALALVAGGLGWSLRSLQPRAAGTSGGAGAAAGAAAPALTARPGTAAADPFWQPWSEARLAELRKKGVPVFVDFTAAWCLSCQVNEAVALDRSEVRARFAELGVVALKADWTARDEAIGRGLEALGRASVPLYALYPAGAPAPVILPELLTPGMVLGYLDREVAGKR